MPAKVKVLIAVTLIQTGLLAVGASLYAELSTERIWLRAAYLHQQGVLKDVASIAGAALDVAEAYAKEVETLKREQFKAQTTEYIRSIDPNAPAEEIAEAVWTAAEETGIDPSWLIAKIKQESYFNPHAVSRTGCRGLAQLCRAASKDVGLDWSMAFDVQANVLAGARYLKIQLDRTGSMHRALIRYNGGDDPRFVQKIERHRARYLRATA